MMSTTTCADYEIARQAHAVLMGESGYVSSDRQYQWSVMIIPMTHQRIGSSPLVYDRRSIERVSQVWSGLVNIVVRPVAEQVQELLAALSLNKSQLARILHAWLAPPYTSGCGVINLTLLIQNGCSTVLHILERASVSSLAPLNARFVRQPPEFRCTVP